MSFVRKLLPVLCLLLCHNAVASETYLLAYYIDLKLNNESGVFQERGIRFGVDDPHVIPMGRGGRGKCVLAMKTVENGAARLVFEIYADGESRMATKAPAYSFDLDMEIGTLGEFKSTEADFSVELAYSVVNIEKR